MDKASTQFSDAYRSKQKSNYPNRLPTTISAYSKSELGGKLGTAPGQRGSGSRESGDPTRITISNQRVNLTVATRHREEEGRERSAPEPMAPGSLNS